MQRHAFAIALAAVGLVAMACVASITMPASFKRSALLQEYVMVPVEAPMMVQQQQAFRRQQLAAGNACESHATPAKQDCCNACQAKVGQAGGFHSVCVPVCEGWMAPNANPYVNYFCSAVTPEPVCDGVF